MRAVFLFLLVFALLPAAGAIRTFGDLSLPEFGGGNVLIGKLFAPDPAVAGPYPVVTMLPGGGAGINSVEWAATRLAGDGYVVIITQPAQGGSAASYNAAARSGLDFLESAANPVLAECDLTRAAACGWSLGGRSLSRTQEEDLRLDCIVAWDNLAISENGDAGSPSGVGSGVPVRTPRVPAMGQASEGGLAGAANKLTAFEHWRAAGQPTAEIALAIGSTAAAHLKWGTFGTEAEHDLFHYYTLAWLDRWLKDDRSATARLTAPEVLGQSAAGRLSTSFLSGLSLDGIETTDLRGWLLAVEGILEPRTFAPSATNSAISTFDSPHHAFYSPAAISRGRLFLFLPGTGGTPSVYQQICKEAALLGWHALGLTYPNAEAVNALCGSDPACAGQVRNEILRGTDDSPLVTVSPDDSIEQRTIKALTYLHLIAPLEDWGQFLHGDGTLRWERIVVAGHSQGGGHAGYISKQHAVSRCLIFAAADIVDGTGQPSAWASSPSATPASRLYGLGHLRDPLVPPGVQRPMWDAIGLPGTELLADGAADLEKSHRFMSDVEPAVAGLSAYHGAMAVDVRLLLLPDGTPAIAPVWRAMLTAPAQAPVLEIRQKAGTVVCSIPSEDGLLYQWQSSTDLIEWTDEGDPQVGDGSVLEWIAPTTDTTFVRVVLF
ncbi:alpha/beta hydrolase family protein [Haloferula sp.]|uniref:alpha/beta hydrolase family protein n=1 Tax=Haloferula sp. TaxID=2497595 RepID=UPI003C74948A